VHRIIDSVGDDALSVEVYLVDDKATDERVNELVDSAQQSHWRRVNWSLDRSRMSA